jgi:hypothetical protein
MPGWPASRQHPESGPDVVTVAERIERLWLAHWPEPVTTAGLPAPAVGRTFVMDTCLRRLVMTTDSVASRSLAALEPPQVFTGTAAYRFLIEVTTGLGSAVPGETNVFGQFKRAWEAHRSGADAASTNSLAAVVARAIQDTRAIRERHLQGIGGASYGTLARRLLQPREGERVLFVGAGELARSMLPFFRAFEVGVWNRRQPGTAFAAAPRWFAPADGPLAAAWAHHVVITTPADPQNDDCWARWLEASPVQTILHLGHRRGDARPGPAHAVSYDLDDLFELRRSQDNIRSLQLQRARLACHEAARQAATPERTVPRRAATA